MCLCIFHLLINYLDQQCRWGPNHGVIGCKAWAPGSGLSFQFGPKSRQRVLFLLLPSGYRHLSPPPHPPVCPQLLSL